MHRAWPTVAWLARASQARPGKELTTLFEVARQQAHVKSKMGFVHEINMIKQLRQPIGLVAHE